MKKFLTGVAFAVLLCGCINIQYNGKTAEKKADDILVTVYSNAEKVTRKYTVLGEAVASGNYQETSRDRMISKLREKARECGASAIIITEQKVVTDDNEKVPGSAFRSAFDQEGTPENWQALARSVDREYVNTNRTVNNASSGSNRNMTRIIKAVFITY